MANTMPFSNRPIWSLDGERIKGREKEVLFRRCFFLVEAYVRSHVSNRDDARNLRQEIMLRVLEGLGKSYHERGRFIPWVLTITVNMVRDYYRRKERMPVMVPIDSESAASHCEKLVDSLGFFWKCRHMLESLERALMKLARPERELILDIFYYKLSFRQAAEKRGISKSACYNLHKRILVKIRKFLKEDGFNMNPFRD